MGDMVGLDLGIQATRKQGRFDPKGDIKHALINAGRLGQKNKKGYYEYVDGRTPTPSPEVHQLVERMRVAAGRGGTPPGQEEIVKRLLYPLVNEGFKCLEEGMAQRPSDIDVCYVHGYGFPRHRGGPMHYADAVGLDEVASSLQLFGVTPAKLLQTCVSNGETLAQHWKRKDRNAKGGAAASKL